MKDTTGIVLLGLVIVVGHLIWYLLRVAFVVLIAWLILRFFGVL